MTTHRVVEADAEALKTHLQSPGLVMVDFWAAWCAPCRAMAPMLDRLAIEFPGVRVVKVDAETHKDVLETYGVRSLPTLQLYRNQSKLEQLIGKVPYELMRRAVLDAA
ncbi:thioredoxin family protein [Methylibium petroleiphilum]|uniref:thioredoxin family protein n=1 Tax=Methylibium petroleiphilum TaxID=105560 RepID=UPI001AD4A022|nr:thioredoxin family protein [Methylibium petroleiphilum]MBN9206922.1 thioredoxin family protein [Methylibium petroleiphilum]